MRWGCSMRYPAPPPWRARHNQMEKRPIDALWETRRDQRMPCAVGPRNGVCSERAELR